VVPPSDFRQLGDHGGRNSVHFRRVAPRYDKTVASFLGFVAIAAFIDEAIADLLAVGRRFARSMRLARVAETLPAIN
jgi:hypothetical protein